jgi:hypothetical protein
MSFATGFDLVEDLVHSRSAKDAPPFGRIIPGTRVILLEEPNRINGTERLRQNGYSLFTKLV